MRALLLFFVLAIFAMASAQRVVITNPDPFFGQPSYPQRPERPAFPNISPAFVNRPYPGKQYNNPLA
ncbi:hypothetical protein, partial [Salmonella enterica]|uniref:hypothetical protein n=1 Tax=Salmonella enterica TaxID=28901 RepID=UPI0032972B37